MEPTVGRIVKLIGGNYPSPEDGCAAIITHVWSGETVNLTVFDSNGVTHSETSVQKAGGANSTKYWDWPVKVPVSA